MTPTPQLRHATMIQYPLAILAWLTALATIFARNALPTDNQDLAALAAHLLFAISTIALAFDRKSKAKSLLFLPVTASLYGAFAGPAIRWKLQLPVAIFIAIAAYVKIPAAFIQPAAGQPR